MTDLAPEEQTDIADASPSAMETELGALTDLLGQLYLYVDWRWLTKQLETEHKERWAQAVEAWSGRMDSASTLRVDRWWLCPTCGIDIRAKLEDGPHENCALARD